MTDDARPAPHAAAPAGAAPAGAARPDVDAFLDRWAASGGAERANAQSFVADLADVLGVWGLADTDGETMCVQPSGTR